MGCVVATLRASGQPKEDGVKFRPTVVAVLAAVVLSACAASEKLSPQLAVRDAANTTVHARQGTFTFSIVGTEDDLNGVLNDGAKLSDEDRKGLHLLGQSHIALTTAEGVWALDVQAGDVAHALELRYVGKKFYARADVPALANLMGTSQSEVNATVDGLAKNGLGFLKDAAAGKWLTADFGGLCDMFKGLADQFGGGGAASASCGSSASPKSNFAQAKDAVGKALADNTSIAKQTSDATGDHYIVTVNSARSLYSAILPVLSQFQLPEKPPAASAVPDRPVSIDAWVKGGRVVRVELPINQFVTRAGQGRVALRIDISHDAPTVTAPSGAVTVDLAGILRTFMQTMLGGLSGAGGLPGMNTVPGLNVPALKGIKS
jgi:hypothetical protein